MKLPLWIAALILIVAASLWLWRRKLVTLVKPDTPLWPVPGHTRITSPFGPRVHPVTGATGSFHNGIDIAAPTGTVVVAPLDGRVMQVYETAAGGKQLIILHAHGLRTGYAHLSAWSVKVGDIVQRGQEVARVGNTGASTGPHLHFTVRPGADKPHMDPHTWLT